MRITNILDRLGGGRWESIFPKITAFFSTGIILIGLNVLILAGSAAYLLWVDPQQPEIVSAAVQEEKLPIAISQVSRAQPSPTPTILPSLTMTPSPSPTFLASPTPLPTAAPALPLQASIEDIQGHRQSMPLSCESRSAVDWAAYFGISIDEFIFHNGLPVSENPDLGFVGDVYGSWGQIPPDPYGVHAEPIAQRLREFGLNAKAVRDMTWLELKTELAAGRPVILWVVGHIAQGTPVPYTTSGGAVTTVSKFEHTVIAVGYTENKITVLDGARVYTRHKGEFLKSWGVLKNQAVIWID